MKKATHSRKHKLPVEKPFCSYLHRFCTQLCIDSYAYCMRHILEDKNAPFRQCTFVHPETHKQCSNAAPKNDKRESLCSYHVRQIQERVSTTPKASEPLEEEKSLLAQLEKYCQRNNHNKSFDPDEYLTEHYRSLPANGEPSELDQLDATVDNEKTSLQQSWLGHSDESESDLDENEWDDPLRHAGVYTYEEVARIHRDKLIQLQSLYIDQFKFLRYELSEARRDYLHSLKNEKKLYGSIYSQPKMSKEDRILYQKLKYMMRYHRQHGKEALLRYKSVQKRLALTNGDTTSPKFSYCVYVDDGEKCQRKTVVLSKFCFKHILFDTKQVMFKKCAFSLSDCWRPVIPYADNNTCFLHARCSNDSAKPSESEKCDDPVAGPSSTSSVSELLKEEQEHFQSMDDIASLGLDAVVPGSLFGLNQFGELGESTDSALSDDRGDLIQINQRMGLSNSDILSDSRKSSE